MKPNSLSPAKVRVPKNYPATPQKVKIPRGWYRLSGSDKLTYSDLCCDPHWHTPEFPVTGMRVEEKHGAYVYIRRLPAKGANKGGK